MKILIDGQTFHTEELNRGIGVYFINILEHMLRNSFVDEFFMVVGDTSNLSVLSSWCRNKLEVIVNPDYTPIRSCYNLGLDNDTLCSEALSKYLAKFDIDIYWNPNPLMNGVFLPKKNNESKFTCTVHDLIPLVMKDVYFEKWNDEAIRDYLRKVELVTEYDNVFCVSRSTQADVLSDLKVPEERTSVIYEGVSDFFVPYPFPEIVSDGPYVLYVGGFDPRKNLFTALEAFARFVERYGEDKAFVNLKFLIVCSYDPDEKTLLTDYAENLGISSRIFLTGFVSNHELLRIYQKAECLFFPSHYEGFGLPIVESLACGIPVACSHVSSLPEVAGDFGFYFDPNDVEGMADALYRSLSASSDSEARLRRWEYVTSRFSWKNAAKEMISAFDGLLFQKAPIQIKTKRRIAWCSSFPPSKSGISNYSNILVRELKKYADVELYYEGERPSKEVECEFYLHHISTFNNNIGAFDEVFYNIGNNTDFHKETYKLAWTYPGTVVLHDWNIHPFLQLSFLGTKDEPYYIEAMLEGYGEEGKRELEKFESSQEPDVFKFSMSDALVKRSKRVIVHNRWVKSQLDDSANVHVVPHFAKIGYHPENAEIVSHKRSYGIADNHFIICCMGFINGNKLPFLQINAINQLLNEGFPVTMVFCGEIYSDLVPDLEEYARRYSEDHFIFTGYQDEVNYWRWLWSSDIILNLRNPTMGEASGTLLQALAVGKATIVSETCQYREFPDSVCWKIPHDDFETEILAGYLRELLTDRNLRNRLGNNAKKYAENQFNVSKIALRYLYGTENLEFKNSKVSLIT